MSNVTLPYSMITDQQQQVKASSVHVQGNFDTLASAVNSRLDLDGSNSPTNDISMANHKLTNVATPITGGDAATKGYVDSLDIANVKLSGDQTIAGNKTFSGTITASSTIQGSISGSSTSCTGNAATVTNGVYTTGNQTIGGTKTFSSVAYGVASAAITSLVTTAGISKSGNGYVKFGNGIMIQWGQTPLITAQGQTVNLPTSFPTACCAVVATMNYNGGSNHCSCHDLTTSSFKMHVGAGGQSYNFIAIGY